MEKSLEKFNPKKGGLSNAELTTLVETGIIPKDTPLQHVMLFAKICKEKNLSPFSRQIHLIVRTIKSGDKVEKRYTPQTGIDGYRAIAERTGLYAGNDDYKFDEGLTEFQMISFQRVRPVTATATIYKIIQGVRCEFSATARWEEYFPGEKQGFMWHKMPFLMLGKCAEALALRKAFPDALSGIYTNEEMQQADYSIVTDSKTVNKSNGNGNGNNSLDKDNPFQDLNKAKDLKELEKIWSGNSDLQTDATFKKIYDKKKPELEKLTQDLSPENMKSDVQAGPSEYDKFYISIKESNPEIVAVVYSNIKKNPEYGKLIPEQKSKLNAIYFEIFNKNKK